MSSKRPTLVWVVTVLYGLAALSMLAGVGFYLSGRVAPTPEGQAYFASITRVDVVMSIIKALIQLVAVGSLFLLKAVAAKLFLAHLLIGLADELRQSITTSWLDLVLSTPGMFLGNVASLAIMFFLVYYSSRLVREGILT